MFIPAKKLVLGEKLELLPGSCCDRAFLKGAGSPVWGQFQFVCCIASWGFLSEASVLEVADGETSGVKAWRILACKLRCWYQQDDCHPCWNDCSRPATCMIACVLYRLMRVLAHSFRRERPSPGGIGPGDPEGHRSFTGQPRSVSQPQPRRHSSGVLVTLMQLGPTGEFGRAAQLWRVIR